MVGNIYADVMFSFIENRIFRPHLRLRNVGVSERDTILPIRRIMERIVHTHLTSVDNEQDAVCGGNVGVRHIRIEQRDAILPVNRIIQRIIFIDLSGNDNDAHAIRGAYLRLRNLRINERDAVVSCGRFVQRIVYAHFASVREFPHAIRFVIGVQFMFKPDAVLPVKRNMERDVFIFLVFRHRAVHIL